MGVSNLSLLVPGAAIFTGSYTPVSWVLRKWQRFHYSHVAMYIGNGRMVESIVGGVSVTLISPYVDTVWHYGEVVVPPLSADALAHAVVMAMAKISHDYDYPLLAGKAIKRIFKWPLKTLRWFNRPNAWTCSELLAYSYREAGLSLGGLTPEQVTPKCLYQIFKEE